MTGGGLNQRLQKDDHVQHCHNHAEEDKDQVEEHKGCETRIGVQLYNMSATRCNIATVADFTIMSDIRFATRGG